MAGYGGFGGNPYGGFGGNPYGGFGGGNPYGGFAGGNIQREFEQERIGFGPQGYGMYEQDVQINRNPYTGATTIVKENEFIPMGRGGGGYMGYGGGGGGFF